MVVLLSRRRRYWERVVALVRRLAMLFMPRGRREAYASRIRRQVFSRIMHEERWGEALSGAGSTLEYTRVTQQIVEGVIREHGVKSMLDIGCGDFVWMPLVLDRLPADFRYVGADVVPDLIERHREQHPRHEFKTVDLVVDELPRCDLIFCRDLLQHLPVKDAIKALENFSRSGAAYLLTTTHLRCFGRRNARDKRVGKCHDRNLLLKPFNLADPIAIFSERDPSHKFLGLWELPLETVDGKKLAGRPPVAAERGVRESKP